MMKLLRRLVVGPLVAVLGAGAAGCSTHQNDAVHSAIMATNKADSAPQLSSGAAPDAGRLEDLLQKRTRDSFGSDFTLGPGDVLEISVPLEQLQHREVRISAQDTITLPLAGVMQVKGMTEQSLTDALRQRLSKYMYDPPVSLFVKQYGSRQVAVIGAVGKPGLYTLMSGSDTLMEMISMAGGMTKDAAAEIIFVPAGAGGAGLAHVSFLGSTKPSQSERQASDSDLPETPSAPASRDAQVQREKVGTVVASAADVLSPESQAGLFGAAVLKLHPIIISMTDPAAQTYLGTPARPGDVIIVPTAGEVTVGGWVQTPGAYKITPGMTALSAISAAGGALFSSSAEILRTAPNGQRSSLPLDISAVKNGKETDIPVQSGDVVMVDRSVAGAFPYAFYELFTKFGTGMYLPVP